MTKMTLIVAVNLLWISCKFADFQKVYSFTHT